jgi:hypothetical protein
MFFCQIGQKKEAIVTLTGTANCFDHSPQYTKDGVTEKVQGHIQP